MPQLSDNFGPYPLSVILDGSGNGTVTFQPNGANARITNLFVKVASVTAQAVCTIYRGQIGDNYIVANTQSGSTGAPASGAIDLFDGETLYIRWTGGDPGALATATLVGTTIPKDDKGPRSTELHWEQPIAAGDGSLIFPALKSPNYVPGVSGWMISRDGDVEFGEGNYRGTILVSNSSGSFISIEPGTDSAFIDLQPADSITPGVTFGPAEIFTGTFGAGGTEQTTLFLTSPLVTAPTPRDNSFMSLDSRSVDGTQPSYAILNADRVSLESQDHVAVGTNPIIESALGGLTYFKGQNGTELVTFVSGPNGQQAVVFAEAFDTGVVPMVFCNINNASGAVARWTAQAFNVTNTGFTIFAQKGAAADGNAAWTNIPVQWFAVNPI